MRSCRCAGQPHGSVPRRPHRRLDCTSQAQTVMHSGTHVGIARYPSLAWSLRRRRTPNSGDGAPVSTVWRVLAGRFCGLVAGLGLLGLHEVLRDAAAGQNGTDQVAVGDHTISSAAVTVPAPRLRLHRTSSVLRRRRSHISPYTGCAQRAWTALRALWARALWCLPTSPRRAPITWCRRHAPPPHPADWARLCTTSGPCPRLLSRSFAHAPILERRAGSPSVRRTWELPRCSWPRNARTRLSPPPSAAQCPHAHSWPARRTQCGGT